MIHRLIIGSLACLLLAGCQSRDAGYDFAIKPAWDHPIDGLQHYSLSDYSNIWVQQGALVTADDITNARLTKGSLDSSAVEITLDAAGTARMSRFTSGHTNQPLAVFVDDQLLSAPVVRSTLSSLFVVDGISDKARAVAFIDRCNELIAARD